MLFPLIAFLAGGMLITKPCYAVEDITCSQVGYKIIKSTDATIYEVDPDNPTPAVFMDGLSIKTSAFAYSVTHKRFYATSLGDAATAKGHLYKIDGDKNITEV